MATFYTRGYASIDATNDIAGQIRRVMTTDYEYMTGDVNSNKLFTDEPSTLVDGENTANYRITVERVE